MNIGSASEATSPSPARYARHAITYGGIAGLLGGSWMIAEYALAQNPERAGLVHWTTLSAMIIPIAAVVLGVTAWRNRCLGGRIRFVQAFGLALAIGLTYSLAVAGAAWLQAAKINPDLIGKSIDQWTVAAAQQPNAQADEIARRADEYRRSTTPVIYAKDRFTRSLMFSLFVGLIAALTVPKKRPGIE